MCTTPFFNVNSWVAPSHFCERQKIKHSVVENWKKLCQQYDPSINQDCQCCDGKEALPGDQCQESDGWKRFCWMSLLGHYLLKQFFSSRHAVAFRDDTFCFFMRPASWSQDELTQQQPSVTAILLHRCVSDDRHSVYFYLCCSSQMVSE